MRPSSSVSAEGLPSVIITDLLHSLALALQDPLREAQPHSIGVVGTTFTRAAGLEALPPPNHETKPATAISRILRPDQLRQRHGHFLPV